MSKTIIESMFALTEKMRNPDTGNSIIINAATTKKAASELSLLRKAL